MTQINARPGLPPYQTMQRPGCAQTDPQTGGGMSTIGDESAHARRRRMEIFAFLFLTAVVMPGFAVATVGSYGLAVWVYQMMAGPPGPPAP
jgi:periplasmic nitrate reductase NapE